MGKTRKNKKIEQPVDVNWRVWGLGAVLFFLLIPLGLYLWTPFTSVEYVKRQANKLKARATVEVSGPPLLRAILGDDPGLWARVTGGTTTSTLIFDATAVKDEDLAILRYAPALKKLSLAGVAITDAGLEFIRYNTQLQDLILSNTPITDASIPIIQKMGNLESLSIDGTPITEVGLEGLKSLPNLKHIDLSTTIIKSEIIEKFKTDCPKVTVRVVELPVPAAPVPVAAPTAPVTSAPAQ